MVASTGKVGGDIPLGHVHTTPEIPKQQPGSSSKATPLARNQGPLSPSRQSSIDRIRPVVEEESAVRSRQRATAKGTAGLNPALAVERSALCTAIQGGAEPPLALLARQFRLEGALLRQDAKLTTALQNDSLLQSALSGAALQHVRPPLEQVYERLNADQAEVVAPPYTFHTELAPGAAGPSALARTLQAQLLEEGLQVRAEVGADDAKSLLAGKQSTHVFQAGSAAALYRGGDGLPDGDREPASLVRRHGEYLDALATLNPATQKEEIANLKLAHAAFKGKEVEQLCLTNEAYERVIEKLRADKAAPEHIADVELAHRAFKAGVALRENELEWNVLTHQINAEDVKNKTLFKTEDKRKAMKEKLKPDLAGMQSVLQGYTQASNVILRKEHVADLEKRGETGCVTDKAMWMKLLEQLGIAGVPQAILSLLHWGYVRNGAKMAAELWMGDKTGVVPAIAAAIVQAVPLGVAHKLASDLLRDPIQWVMEKAFKLRPTEPTRPDQVHLPIRRSELDADGNVVYKSPDAIDSEQKARVQEQLQFAAEAGIFGFGHASGDNAGEFSFAAANIIRDGAASVYEGADSIHAKALASATGGASMATAQSFGQIHHKIKVTIDGQDYQVPAGAPARRPNPRDFLLRLTSAAQKLDLTDPDNRKDLWSKILSAFIGIAIAEGIDQVVTLPIEAARKIASEGRKRGWDTLHAVVEGIKSVGTLAPFFSGLVAAGDAKKVTWTTNGSVQRIAVGPYNVSHAASKKAIAAYPNRFGKGREFVNNAAKGTFQTMVQPVVEGVDAPLALLGKAFSGSGKKPQAAAAASKAPVGAGTASATDTATAARTGADAEAETEGDADADADAAAGRTNDSSTSHQQV